jgi:histidinol-phosphate aminotransferase
MKEYAFDLDAMAERITPQTRLIAIANPNNPTGTIVRRSGLDAFIDKVPDHVLVVLDEAYCEYVSDSDYPNSLDYVRNGKPVLILRTFSKVFGLAGLRIGYGISTREVIDTLYKVRMAFNTNSVAQVAALAAWDDHEHVKKSVRLNREGLEALYSGFRDRRIQYVPSHANFVLVELHRPARYLTQALLRQGVIVRPAWGCPTCMRVSVGTPDQIERFFSALDNAL